jgi:hypothetical protein|tara:strand:+ start:858 stop:1151 length:294 start_codon:yes stop_codon:yes gene_type:complete
LRARSINSKLKVTSQIYKVAFLPRKISLSTNMSAPDVATDSAITMEANAHPSLKTTDRLIDPLQICASSLELFVSLYGDNPVEFDELAMRPNFVRAS